MTKTILKIDIRHRQIEMIGFICVLWIDSNRHDKHTHTRKKIEGGKKICACWIMLILSQLCILLNVIFFSSASVIVVYNINQKASPICVHFESFLTRYQFNNFNLGFDSSTRNIRFGSACRFSSTCISPLYEQ